MKPQRNAPRKDKLFKLQLDIAVTKTLRDEFDQHPGQEDFVPYATIALGRYPELRKPAEVAQNFYNVLLNIMHKPMVN